MNVPQIPIPNAIDAPTVLMPLAVAKCIDDAMLGDDEGVKKLLAFQSEMAAVKFNFAWSNRKARSNAKNGVAGQGPKLAILTVEMGRDLIRVAETIAFFHRSRLELGLVEPDEVESLIALARSYSRQVGHSTYNHFLQGNHRTSRVLLMHEEKQNAQRGVLQYFIDRDSAALMRIPVSVAQLAHTYAPTGLVTAEGLKTFWQEIAEADLRADFAGKGPLMLLDLHDLADLYTYARGAFRASTDKAERSAWNHLIYQIKGDYGQELDKIIVKA